MLEMHVYTCIIAKTHKHDFVTFFFIIIVLSASISRVGCSSIHWFRVCVNRRTWVCCWSSNPSIWGEKWNRNFRLFSFFDQLQVCSNCLFICFNICDTCKTKIKAGLSRNWIRRKALKPPLNFNTMLHYILRGREERNVRPKQKLIMGW